MRELNKNTRLFLVNFLQFDFTIASKFVEKNQLIQKIFGSIDFRNQQILNLKTIVVD